MRSPVRLAALRIMYGLLSYLRIGNSRFISEIKNHDGFLAFAHDFNREGRRIDSAHKLASAVSDIFHNAHLLDVGTKEIMPREAACVPTWEVA